jgi:xanthine dehydrogenase accessory factor
MGVILMKPIYESLLNALKEGNRSVLVTLISCKGNIFQPPGSKRLFTENKAIGNLEVDWLRGDINRLVELSRKTNQLEKGTVFFPGDREKYCTLIAEPIYGIEKLVVLGGGNIARPLVSVADLLGYHVIVVDDRPEFANPERFPEAQEVICSDFYVYLESMSVDSWTSVVIVTRGHQYDLHCLEMLSGRDMAYLGMIGSKQKVELAKKHLLTKGIPVDKIKNIYAPIGLDVRAQTPEEIAVSIAAELIKVRRGGRALSLSEGLKAGEKAEGYLQRSSSSITSDTNLFRTLLSCIKDGAPVALATIVSTTGSTPRKAGAKMLIFPNGTIEGTIGGGVIEEEIRKLGFSVLETNQANLYRFQIDNKTAAFMGMFCGGDLEVFIDPIKGE